MIIAGSSHLVVANCIGFKGEDSGLAGIGMGFNGYHFKTCVNSSIIICQLLRPIQIASSYGEPMASTCYSTPVSSEAHGFRRFHSGFASTRMGFNRYHLRTHANNMQVMPPTLETYANARNCLLALLWVLLWLLLSGLRWGLL